MISRILLLTVCLVGIINARYLPYIPAHLEHIESHSDDHYLAPHFPVHFPFRGHFPHYPAFVNKFHSNSEDSSSSSESHESWDSSSSSESHSDSSSSNEGDQHWEHSGSESDEHFVAPHFPFHESYVPPVLPPVLPPVVPHVPVIDPEDDFPYGKRPVIN